MDTNILLYFLKGDKEVIEMIAEKELIISFITELELLSFGELAPGSEGTIRELLDGCFIVNITPEIKTLTISIRRQSRLKLPDAIIAATAGSMKLPLVTADRQFKSVEELDVIMYEL